MAIGLNGGAPKYSTTEPYYIQHENRAKRRRWCLVLTGIVVLIVVICAIAIPVSMRNKKGDDKGDEDGSGRVQSPLEEACNATRFFEVCMETVGGISGVNSSDPRDLVRAGLLAASNGISQEIERAEDLLDNYADDANLTVSARACIDDLVESLQEINDTLSRLDHWDVRKVKQQLEDLQTWMSSAMTLEETCHDEFLDLNVTGAPVESFLASGNRTQMILSNALSLITSLKRITERITGRRLLSADPNEEWVRPLRKLLQATETIPADVVVAQDGSGDFKTIQDAVNSAPQKSNTRFVIHIKTGIYEEYVEVKKNFWNLMFVGDGPGKTIITGSRSVVGSGMTTSKTGTLIVLGKGFVGRDFTVANTAGAINHQAVALRVGGDMSAFWRCEFLGHQDTLYTHNNRQFYKECVVEGTVDFVFGNAACVLQDCTILARVGLPGQQVTFTAQGRTDPNMNTGLSFQRCIIDGTKELVPKANEHAAYLGRPWKPYSVTVFMQSQIGSIVRPEGWLLWNGETQHLSTIYYAEYMNKGPGAGTSQRVKWSFQITNPNDARRFTPNDFLGATSWLPGAGIKYSGTL